MLIYAFILETEPQKSKTDENTFIKHRLNSKKNVKMTFFKIKNVNFCIYLQTSYLILHFA